MRSETCHATDSCQEETTRQDGIRNRRGWFVLSMDVSRGIPRDIAKSGRKENVHRNCSPHIIRQTINVSSIGRRLDTKLHEQMKICVNSMLCLMARPQIHLPNVKTCLDVVNTYFLLFTMATIVFITHCFLINILHYNEKPWVMQPMSPGTYRMLVCGPVCRPAQYPDT